MSVIDKSRLLLFIGGTVPVPGVSAGDLGALATKNAVGTLDIADKAVTLSRMADRNPATFLGRRAGEGSGPLEELSAPQARGVLGVKALALKDNVGTEDIQDKAVTLSRMADRNPATFLGRRAGEGPGPLEELSAPQAREVLGVKSAALQEAADFATAGQGALAASAVQPAALLPVVESVSGLSREIGVRTGYADPRDGEAPFAVGVQNIAGQQAGFGDDMAAHAAALNVYDDVSGGRDDLGPERVSLVGVITPGGAIVGDVVAVTRDGRLELIGLDLSDRSPSTVDPRDAEEEIRAIIAAGPAGAQRVLLGLSEEGLLVVPGIQVPPGYRSPSEMLGAWGQFNIRRSEEFVYATVQARGGIVGDIKQRTDMASTTALAVGQALELNLVIGQSNAGSGSGPAGAPLLRNPGLPHHLLATRAWTNAYGTTDSTASLGNDADLIPLTEITSQAQSPACMWHAAMSDLEARAWRAQPRGVFTSWEGAQPIASFLPGASGHWNHENAIAGLKALSRCATPYQVPVKFGAVLFVHGENGSADYDVALAQYIDDVLPLFGSEIAQPTPHFLFRQINSPVSATSIGTHEVPLKQLAVARERLGDGVTLTGPMYHLPLHDSIHADNLGRMMGGEQDAVACLAARAGGAWHPLWPVAGGVTRAGVTITIPMELPPGATGLAWDEDWVLPVPNRGFVYSDSGSGATISAVEISGAGIVITLSADPGSATGQTIEYACITSSDDPGWSAGRGQLYARTGIPSPFNARGFPVPAEIRLYCVRFRETIS